LGDKETCRWINLIFNQCISIVLILPRNGDKDVGNILGNNSTEVKTVGN